MMEGLENLPAEVVLAAFKHLDIPDVETLAQRLLSKVTEPAYRDRLSDRAKWLLRMQRNAQAWISNNHNEQDVLVPTFPGFADLHVLEGEVQAKARWPAYRLSPAQLQSIFNEQPPRDLCRGRTGQRDYNSMTQTRFRKSPPDPRSWGVELNGSLLWLQQLPKVIPPGSKNHQSASPQLSASVLQQEVSLLKQPGIVLPPGFIAFMSIPEKYQRVPSSQGWYFCLGDRDAQFHAEQKHARRLYMTKGIYIEDPDNVGHVEPREIITSDPTPDSFRPLLVKVRVNNPKNNSQNGFIVLFHQDPAHKVYTYLYLSTDGSHCVLTSPINYYKETTQIISTSQGSKEQDFDEDDGICLRDVALAGLSFEEYLYAYYFDELVCANAPLETPGLREYIENMYVSIWDIERISQRYPQVKGFRRRWEGLRANENLEREAQDFEEEQCGCKECDLNAAEPHLRVDCRCSSCVTEEEEVEDGYSSNQAELDDDDDDDSGGCYSPNS